MGLLRLIPNIGKNNKFDIDAKYLNILTLKST
jgi:hypothetical protein